MPRDRSRRRFHRDPDLVLAKLQEIIRNGEERPDADLIVEMLDGIVKLAETGAERGDLKMLNHALLELRRGFRVFAPYRRVRKVSVFGSARTTPDRPEYVMARDFANRMTRSGFMVITGAGPGIMEAAQGGAGRARSFGVNIRLPFEQTANPHIHDDPKLVNFKYFFTRKVMFVKETDAIALFPGGFGTHDEGFESLTLVQTGKSHLIPLVFVDKPGGSYWRDWLGYIRTHLVDGGYINREDLELFTVTDDLDTAVETIRQFYVNYHSIRYVRPRFILRHRFPIGDELLDRLNSEFADVLVDGRFERLEAPMRVESDEPRTAKLHRLAFRFDRRSFGRLRKLVDLLNASCPART